MSYYVPPAFLENPDALQAVYTFFNQIKLDSPHVEVEGRVGTFDQKRFESWVDPAWFHEKLAFFVASASQFDAVEDDTTTSYLFENGVRAVQKQDETAVFVRKERKASLDMAFAGCDYQFRIAYSLEIPQEPPHSPSVWVRLRHRKSFYCGTFRFDFSNIVEGKTHEEARQQNSIKHEIEIEIVPINDGNGNKKEAVDKQYLALSLLFLLHDLVTENGTDCSEEPRTLSLLQAKRVGGKKRIGGAAKE